MKRAIIMCAVFLVVVAASCFLAWVGGFNFDKRNPDVAIWAAMTLVFAGMPMIPLWHELGEKK